MKPILIRGAREGNLKNIDLEIPKNQLVVLTGVSGSGKSTLALDVIYQECQRQYLEAMGYQGIHKPDLDGMQHVSPAIWIGQNSYHKNVRSTVGTVTNIYTDLRMVYEKLCQSICPACKKWFYAYECKEELEGKGETFAVYQNCPHCHSQIPRLTRTFFSYNTREGACPTCKGMGKVMELNSKRVLHEEKSLEDGAVDFWEYRYGTYMIGCYEKTLQHYGMRYHPNTPVSEFSEIQRTILLEGTDSAIISQTFPNMKPPKSANLGKFEGILPTLWRKLSEKGGVANSIESYFDSKPCPDCQGERLNQTSRMAKVKESRLPELSNLPLEQLLEWLTSLEENLDDLARNLAGAYLLDLRTKISRLMQAGLGYLSLDRQTMTLSGGEAQRIKLSAALTAEVSGIIYLLDEPTIGLHPADTKNIIAIMKALVELENTVLVIEHDQDVIRAADYIIDIGPGSGRHGGEITGTGTYEQLKNQETSVTGNYFRKKDAICPKPHRKVRQGEGFIEIQNASLYNLQNLTVRIPQKCLTAVTGVSGSGKSTLIFEVLAKQNLEEFQQIICVEQSPIARMKRSNIATYTGIYTEIRKIFGNLEESKKHNLTASHFSFNSKGGRCDNCEGLGYVVSNMLFFEDKEVPCPICHGKQFQEEILSITYHNKNIHQILQLSIEEANQQFRTHKSIAQTTALLMETGLGYLELGQTLTTLSGGECQRLKLAKELLDHPGTHNLYLMDEPTTGLHPQDVDHFLLLLNRIVDTGSTVIIVEHNQQLIESADWIIDLGPGGGRQGGHLIAEGPPSAIHNNKHSQTGKHLYKHSQT